MYILLTIRFGIEFSSKPHHPPRRVYCPPRPHQWKKSLHPGSWVLHMVVALKSMSLLIGLKHIDTFSIIKNKRSKKKGKRRNKSILVNDSLNRSNSLNPDFKFIHEQTSFLGYSQSYRWCTLEFWSFTRIIRYSGPESQGHPRSSPGRWKQTRILYSILLLFTFSGQRKTLYGP